MTTLAKLRAKELGAACAELGVTEHWYLGGPGRWRDSGPRGCDDPRAFASAELDETTDELAALVRKVQPQVMVTYDANGFYGHPDHVQAHRVAWHLYQQACNPLRTKFYALTMPRPVLAVDSPFFEPAGLPRMRVLGTEYYTLLAHPSAVTTGSRGQERENDLFSGM